MVRCGLLVFRSSEIETLLVLGLLPWHLCGWEARCWALHVLSLFCLHLILPPLTIKDSVLYGTKYYCKSSLISLSPPDFFLKGSICQISLLMVLVNLILANPLTNDMRMPIEIIQCDFMQGEA